MESSERIEIQTTRTMTIFEIAFSKRSDAGKYTLEVSNELGSAVGRANVSVVDRPDPPEFIRVSGITSNSCDLNWGASPDDGGSPITHYLVEKCDMSRSEIYMHDSCNLSKFGV